MPRLSKDDFRKPQERGLAELTYKFQVVTSVFGGGVALDQDESKHHQKPIDVVTPVRGAAVRGQLRFWWRATQGSRAATPAEMKKREDELWGSAQKPGLVSLHLLEPPEGAQSSPEKVFEMVPSRSGKLNPRVIDDPAVGYGAFPLQPGKKGTGDPGVLHRVSGTWTLVLLTPSAHTEEVKTAVEAWLLFGGIGGRTRRGFGAVDPGSSQNPRAFLSRLSAGGALSGVPSIGPTSRVVEAEDSFDSADGALRYGLDRLQSFRQGPGIGRNPGKEDPKRPGRSKWPEADAIRRVTKQRSSLHRDDLDRIDAFPRAAFGLPIVFHFKDDDDPKDTTLYPDSGRQRHASQLILRPFRTSKGFGALALVLDGEPSATANLELRSIGHEALLKATGRLTKAQAENIRVQPAKGQTDVLGAFLTFFQKTSGSMK
jgi:CRISPR-associated protein Cmr1